MCAVIIGQLTTFWTLLISWNRAQHCTVKCIWTKTGHLKRWRSTRSYWQIESRRLPSRMGHVGLLQMMEKLLKMDILHLLQIEQLYLAIFSWHWPSKLDFIFLISGFVSSGRYIRYEIRSVIIHTVLDAVLSTVWVLCFPFGFNSWISWVFKVLICFERTILSSLCIDRYPVICNPNLCGCGWWVRCL